MPHMDKLKALQRASVDYQKPMRGPIIGGQYVSGLDQATRDAIVINALRAIGVQNIRIPGRTGNA